jgi:hypothetical protein
MAVTLRFCIAGQLTVLGRAYPADDFVDLVGFYDTSVR